MSRLLDQTDRPTLADLLAQSRQGTLDRVRTCIPGVVISYDAAAQKADVRPAVRTWYTKPDTGEEESELPAVIPNCPVLHYSAGDYSIHFPLAAGSSVLILVAHASIDEWLQTGQEDCEPWDRRVLDWTDALVLPGGRSFSAQAGARGPLPSAARADGAMVLRAPEVRLGSSGATAALVTEDLLGALEGALTEVSAALGGLGFPPTMLPNLTALLTALALPTSYRTSKVKGE